MTLTGRLLRISDNVFRIIELIICIPNKIVEIEKNEDTSYEEVDMVDATNRQIAVAVGLIMILGAVFLLLLSHK